MALLLLGVSGDVRESAGNLSEAEISAGSIALARKRATNIVNGYLEKKYPSSIPFATAADVPELVHTLTTDLSVYYIKRDSHPGPVPLAEDVKSEYYEKVIEMLEKIAEGELAIPELEAKDDDSIYSAQSEYTPTFAQDDVEDSIIDGDKLEDISDARD